MKGKSRNRNNQPTVVVALAAFKDAGVEPDGHVARLSGTKNVDVRLSAAAGKAMATVAKEDHDRVLAVASGLAAKAGRGHGIRRIYDEDVAKALDVPPAQLRKQGKYRPAAPLAR